MCRHQMLSAAMMMMMMIVMEVEVEVEVEVEMRVMDMAMRGCHGRLSCKGCKPAMRESEGICAVEVAATGSC